MTAMNDVSTLSDVSRAARCCSSAGRAVGSGRGVRDPLVLARMFDPAEFGTYKQFFLVYATLYGLAQLGMAESLYYFVPREPADAGRHVANAMVTLALSASPASPGCLRLALHDRRVAHERRARRVPLLLGSVPGVHAGVGACSRS